MSTEITTEPADRDARVKDAQGFAWKRAAAGDEPCSNCWTTELGGAHRSWRGLLKERGPLTLVEAEWAVGQQVSGDDYPKLPIGSVVFDEPTTEDTVQSVPVMKTGEDEWTNQGWPGVFTNAEMADDVRTLTQLGDGVADIGIVEPRACRVCGCTENDCSGCIERTGQPCSWVEDDLCSACTDGAPAAPLKDGDAVLVWVKVANGGIQDSDDMFRVWINPDGARFAVVVQVEPDAIVRPADGQVPPWVKPAQCPSLKDESDCVRIQCTKDADVLVHMHRAVYAGVEVHWTDAQAYGRVEVSS